MRQVSLRTKVSRGAYRDSKDFQDSSKGLVRISVISRYNIDCTGNYRSEVNLSWEKTLRITSRSPPSTLFENCCLFEHRVRLHK